MTRGLYTDTADKSILVAEKLGAEISEASTSIEFLTRTIEDSSDTLPPRTTRDVFWLDNSTEYVRYPNELKHRMKKLFFDARDEVFEDGVKSDFSKNLVRLIRQYGYYTINVVFDFLNAESINEEVLSEALRWIGQINDKQTHSNRLWILEEALKSPSARIRDGAILGISFMDDVRSRKAVKLAIRNERISELRSDMIDVLEQLGK